MTPLLAVLHLTDTLFPIGSFAHSDGLEAATQSGGVSRTDLAAWLDVCLDETFGKLEGPTLADAWGAVHQRSLEQLVTVDEESTALRPAWTARRASRAMGLRLLTGWEALYPAPALKGVLALVRQGKLGPTLPVAFGVACSSAGVELRASAQAFGYSRLAATVSAAMRLMSVGQAEAHGLLARMVARLPAVVDTFVEPGPDAGAARVQRSESFTPAMDIAAMTHPYLHSRLFLS